jgi:DNA polymerase-3 subunit gamma/tau
MPSLGRAWQILLKGLAEVNTAPNPQAAAEMVLIRLMYAADLPDPADLLKKLKDQNGSVNAGAASQVTSSARSPEPVALRAVSGGAPMAVSAPVSASVSNPASNVAVANLHDVVTLLEQQREIILASHVYQFAHLVKFQEGHIELRVEPDAHPKLAQEVGRILSTLTSQRWMVSVSGATGAPTLSQQEKVTYEARLVEARKNPVVAEVLQLFPGAKLEVKTISE